MDPNIQNENQNPFPAQPARTSGNIGGLIAAVIVVVMLAAGGFYFLYAEQQSAGEPQPETSQTTSSGQEDSLDVIGGDLEATQTTGAEADVAELESAL